MQKIKQKYLANIGKNLIQILEIDTAIICQMNKY